MCSLKLDSAQLWALPPLPSSIPCLVVTPHPQQTDDWKQFYLHDSVTDWLFLSYKGSKKYVPRNGFNMDVTSILLSLLKARPHLLSMTFCFLVAVPLPPTCCNVQDIHQERDPLSIRDLGGLFLQICGHLVSAIRCFCVWCFVFCHLAKSLNTQAPPLENIPHCMRNSGPPAALSLFLLLTE